MKADGPYLRHVGPLGSSLINTNFDFHDLEAIWRIWSEKEGKG